MMRAVMPASPPAAAVVGILRVTRAGGLSLERLARSAQPGRVHSVFDRAVNILWGDGRLFTLHGPGPLAAPFALALERLPARAALAPGMPMGRSELDCTGAERVALEMPEGAIGFDAEVLPARPSAPALDSPAGRRALDALAH